MAPVKNNAGVAHISGSATEATKRAISNPGKFFGNYRPDIIKKPIFGEEIFRRMKVVEVSVDPKEEEEKKLEAKVVIEIEVAEGAQAKAMLMTLVLC